MPEPRGPPLPPLGVPVLRRAARLRRAGGERVSCGKMRRVFACGVGGGEAAGAEAATHHASFSTPSTFAKGRLK